ncbi:MAG: N-acetylmuramoyl-L-alanine amidase [Duncaniella sp.]|nr:N-acetylmuramoyl-L-alanine amidase [Muribaculum sp.]MCM1255835.1 N-acetylmuramoyl-L-alanine amidase [Duncaniella sp.]
MLLLAFSVPTAGAKEFVVVIDPGHGGKDAGALGKKTNEKTVNLEVATRLEKLLTSNMDDVKVYMTRSNDTFVPLQGRADFANGKNADIFISIHANSVDAKSPVRNTVNGAAVYTLGLKKSDTNLSVAMRENSVMKLEPDYSTTYQGFDPSSAESYIIFEMMQHKNLDQSITLAEHVQNQLVRTAGRKNNGVRQAPFWVLVRTSMPAILVELDFICNPTMEKFMASSSGQDKLAKAIYNGVERYRNASAHKPDKSPKSGKTENPQKTAKESDYGTDPQQSENETKTKSLPEVSDTPTGTVVYKIQFLISHKKLQKNDKRLNGLSPVEFYKDGGNYKYTFGAYKSISQANKELTKVKKKFPDAFVIKTHDGKRIK